MLYNEIFPPIIEKQKTLDANERSACQLLELFDKNKDKPKSYRFTAKSHPTLFPKNFIPLYLEDLRFLSKTCGSKITKSYTHFTFEQSRFKRDFVLNNQRKRQKANPSIEKYFYKLMNNANFGYDCRDNTNNANFQSIIDEVNEITYIKNIIIFSITKFRVSKFVNSDVVEQQINQQFEQNISTVKYDNPYKTARMKTSESQKNEEVDALKCLKEK